MDAAAYVSRSSESEAEPESRVVHLPVVVPEPSSLLVMWMAEGFTLRATPLVKCIDTQWNRRGRPT
jgi:hypothetical protein